MMSNQFHLNKTVIFKFRIIYFYYLFCIFIQSCQKEDNSYNPCLKHYQYESFTPATRSLDWIPYIENQELLFSNSQGAIIKLKRIVNNEISESLKSLFKIRCPKDSSQNSFIDYTTFEYRNTFIVSEGKTTLLSININADVILDEKNSNLDEAKLADIIKLDFKIKNIANVESTTQVLQFPVLDRGYKEALSLGYLYNSTILLNNKLYTEVYSNYENNEQLKAYYSIHGLLGFEIQGDLFVKIN